MKVTVKQQPEEFKPVTLEITLESREELEAMYKLGGWGCEVESFVSEKEQRKIEVNRILYPIYSIINPLP
jgi:hypothetical protein